MPVWVGITVMKTAYATNLMRTTPFSITGIVLSLAVVKRIRPFATGIFNPGGYLHAE